MHASATLVDCLCTHRQCTIAVVILHVSPSINIGISYLACHFSLYLMMLSSPKRVRFKFEQFLCCFVGLVLLIFITKRQITMVHVF